MLTHINVDAWKTVHSDRTEFPWSVAVELFPVLQKRFIRNDEFDWLNLTSCFAATITLRIWSDIFYLVPTHWVDWLHWSIAEIWNNDTNVIFCMDIQNNHNMLAL